MANNLAANPYIVDTTMSTSLKNTANSVFTTPINIQKIVWDSGASGVAGDTFVIQYGDGTTFMQHTLAVAKDTKQIDFFGGKIITDFKVSTLAHGTLFIYYE